MPTVEQGDITNSPFSDELNDAYLYAFDAGITSKDNILDADLNGSLNGDAKKTRTFFGGFLNVEVIPTCRCIRAHMAKMIVNYAIEVLDMTPDTTLACNFSGDANLL